MLGRDMPLRSQKSVLMLLGNYSPAAHRGIARFAAEHRWHLHADMSRIPVVPHGWTGDGIVAGLGEWDEPIRFLQSRALRKVPVVDIYYMHPELPLPRVIGDHWEIGRLAAEHFLERGWRHFSWFSRVNHHVASLRWQGYSQTLARLGLTAHRLAATITLDLNTHNWSKLRQSLVHELRRQPKPLALFAFNDFDGALVMDACVAAGLRVPEDVGVLGVDDNELVVNCVHVPMSSVRLDLERIGYEGAALLDKLMKGRRAPKTPHLIVPRGVALRASTDTFAVNHSQVHTALRFIHTHLHRSLGVLEIAGAVGVSRRTLEMLFRQELHCSVHEELMRQRLRRVCDSLAETANPVDTIAAATGFCHSSHLHRVFVAAVGTTPRQYRLQKHTLHHIGNK